MWRLFVWGIPLLLVILAMVPGSQSDVFRRMLDPMAMARGLDNLGRYGVAKTLAGETVDPARDNPLSHVRARHGAWVGDERVIATENGMPVFQMQVFAGQRPNALTDVPGAAARVPVLADCAGLGAPIAGAHVAFVQGETPGWAGLVAPDDAVLREEVARYLRDLRYPGKAGRGMGLEALQRQTYSAFDVAVTETAAPVHLVLSGDTARPRLWNLQIGPGVRLARVTLLGGGRDGVAHLPAGVPLEVLPRAAMAACGALESYPYSDLSLVHQSRAIGAIKEDEYAEMSAKLDAAYADWAGWFAGHFGEEPLALRVGFDEGLGALVGPVPATPEARLVWAPVAGAPITLPEGVAVMPASPETGAALNAQLEAKAREIAGPAFEKLAQTPRHIRVGGI